MNSTLLSLYEYTGPSGVAISLLAFASLYLIIRNSVYLGLVHRDFMAYFAEVERGGPLLKNTTNPLIAIVQGVASSHAIHSKDLRAEVAYLFHVHFRRVLNALAALRLISVISPLLGLLGTVLGMVKVFRVVASNTHADMALLASGIWEALITTVMGLVVAIPTLVFFYLLRIRMNRFHVEAVEYGYRTLGIIHSDRSCGKEAVRGRQKKTEEKARPLAVEAG